MHRVSQPLETTTDQAHRSPGEVLAEAGRLYDRGDFATSALRYEEVISLIPATDVYARALFGAALAYEGVGDLLTASLRYRRLGIMLDDPPDTWSPPLRLALDARFRLAYVEMAREEWTEAITAWNRVLDLELTLPDQVEALLRRGLARQAIEAFDRAQMDYESVLALYRRHPEHPRLAGAAAVSRAQFQLGEVYRAHFARVRLRLPLESMRGALEEKSILFLKSQGAFLDTLRLRNAHWAVAAGERLGQLYEEMYFGLLDAEVPADFDDETRAVYQAEMKEHVRPHIERAVELYETNLEIARRLGHQGEWVQKSQKRLVRLRELLAEPGVRDYIP